jgi:hypothetical protein
LSDAADNRQLLDSIRQLLGSGALPQATVADKGYDLYEAFLLGLVVSAGRDVLGSQSVWYETAGIGRTADVRRLRTSPGAIHTSHLHGYTHAVMQIDANRRLEAHLGIYVSGRSNVPHEADIALLDGDEANRARLDNVEPKSNKLLVALEAKYYAGTLPLSLGREYVGLHADLGARQRMLVSSSSAVRVSTLLASRLKVGAFRPYVVAGTSPEADELRYWLRTVIRQFRDT